MTGRATDRKKKELKQVESTVFILPNSLPCSEIVFPILIRKPPRANWHAIIKESDQKQQEIELYVKSKKEAEVTSPFLKTECDYIQNKVFTYLLPALEETLNKAKIWDALNTQKCFFNGIDHIVQVLWNNNPRHLARQTKNLHVFNMPWVRTYLQQHPRPYYPKSWLWPEDFAATLIQKTVRQYFVQREDDVQEMREFWRKLKLERGHPEIETNPLLSRKLASESNFRKRISH